MRCDARWKGKAQKRTAAAHRGAHSDRWIGSLSNWLLCVCSVWLFWFVCVRVLVLVSLVVEEEEDGRKQKPIPIAITKVKRSEATKQKNQTKTNQTKRRMHSARATQQERVCSTTHACGCRASSPVVILPS